MAGVIRDFTLDSLDELPYKRMNKHTLKPNKHIIIKEIKRRHSSFKRLDNRKLEDLLIVLKETIDTDLPEDCLVFINQQFNEAKRDFQMKVVV